MKRCLLILISLFSYVVSYAISEEEVRKIVQDYYQALQRFSYYTDQTDDGIRQRRLIKSMIIDGRGVIFDDISYKLAKLPVQEMDFDTYIINGLFGHEKTFRFSPKNILVNNTTGVTESVYELSVSDYYSYKQYYVIKLKMQLKGNKILNIQKYEDTLNFRIEDLVFRFWGSDNKWTEWYVEEMKSDNYLWIQSSVLINSSTSYNNVVVSVKIKQPNGMCLCDKFNYTFCDTINIKDGKNWYNLKYYCLSGDKYVSPGKYEYVINYNNKSFTKTFLIKNISFEITDIDLRFQNTDGKLSDYGITKADSGSCQWVSSRVKIKSFKKINQVPILKRIIMPNGAMMTCASCGVPNNYTASDTIDIDEGEKWYYLNSFGYPKGSYQDKGVYTYELWSNDVFFTKETFEIVPPMKKNVDFLEITNVEFVGLDKKGNEITKPVKEGEMLSSSSKKIKGIKVKLYYTKLSQDINLNVVFDVEGKNLRSDYYTNSDTITLQKNTTQYAFKIKYDKMPQNKYIRIEISHNKSNTPNAKSKFIYKVKLE